LFVSTLKIITTKRIQKYLCINIPLLVSFKKNDRIIKKGMRPFFDLA